MKDADWIPSLAVNDNPIGIPLDDKMREADFAVIDEREEGSSLRVGEISPLPYPGE